MSDRSFSLGHISRPAGQPVGAKQPAILLLHGFGANEQDLLGLAPYLDPRFHILSARAPLTMGGQMYAWYALHFLADGSFEINEDEARESVAVLRSFIDEAIEAYDLDRDQFYLVGFSQGAIQGSAILLLEPEAVAGLVAMSGRWPVMIDDEIAAHERLDGKPVLAVHGLYDPVIQIRYGREVRDKWGALPVDFTYQEYPMAHEISADSLALVRQWLQARLQRSEGAALPEKSPRGT